VSIIKKSSLVTPPKVLCLHMKRVFYDHYGSMSLSRSYISYPDILDLSRVVMLREDGIKFDAKYKLCGVIEHFGTALGGHYIAYRPLDLSSYTDPNEKWIICDDNNVQEVTK
jgi:ubiquitin C-terminal hydrolase